MSRDQRFIAQLATQLREARGAEDLEPGDLAPGGWFERMAVLALQTAFDAGKKSATN